VLLLNYSVTNSSSVDPPPPFVPARVTSICVGGPNASAPCSVDTECPSSTCGPAVISTLAVDPTTFTTELPGTLTYTPLGANGCEANAPEVTKCELDPLNPNKVNIFVNSTGVPLPAGGQAFIARIRVTGTTSIPPSDPNNPCTSAKFGTRADAAFGALRTTD